MSFIAGTRELRELLDHLTMLVEVPVEESGVDGTRFRVVASPCIKQVTGPSGQPGIEIELSDPVDSNLAATLAASNELPAEVAVLGNTLRAVPASALRRWLTAAGELCERGVPLKPRPPLDPADAMVVHSAPRMGVGIFGVFTA